ncbi:MAG: 16S rRNA (cytosine(1402)-N(4))-methyltransferase RsmH [Deltaproteobacteria bacterium]|nr:16S rRNA (cytosine(1402)-N(4))-methyltransferase RsmH [Candidatus Anaeroferrophillacea bacterium]
MTHIPVLLEASLEYLALERFDAAPGVVVDATFGGGGHAVAMLERGGGGLRVVAIDRDPEAVGRAAALQQRFGDRFALLGGNFAELGGLLDAQGIGRIDGLLFDLGFSSFQIDTAGRGFSFQHDGPLDMRMDPGHGRSATDILAGAEVGELEEIFRRYGEEPRARAVARAVVRARAERPLTRTVELANLVAALVPVRERLRQRLHPATRIFQALRIAVNDELTALADGLEAGIGRLRPGGRVVVIAYHSLEDRLVKQFFRRRARTCTCPPGLPVCHCGTRPDLEILTSRPVMPTPAETAANPRSRSARLRAGVRR